MKKLCLCLLLLAFCLPCLSCLAESVLPDFSTYTDAEIEQAYAAIVAEYQSRGLPQTATFPEGTYKIGTHIPAGSYIYTNLDDAWYSVVKIYDTFDAESESFYDNCSVGETLFISFSDGQKFVSDEPFTLTPYVMPFQ